MKYKSSDFFEEQKNLRTLRRSSSQPSAHTLYSILTTWAHVAAHYFSLAFYYFNFLLYRKWLLGVGGLLLASLLVLYTLHNCSYYKILVIDVELPESHVHIPSQAVFAKGENLPKSSTALSLVDQLYKLIFLNAGVATRKDEFVWKRINCGYLESQNVSLPYIGWADVGGTNYLYQENDGYLVSPPSGMRSSVPHGGGYGCMLFNDLQAACWYEFCWAYLTFLVFANYSQ